MAAGPVFLRRRRRRRLVPWVAAIAAASVFLVVAEADFRRLFDTKYFQGFRWGGIRGAAEETAAKVVQKCNNSYSIKSEQ